MAASRSTLAQVMACSLTAPSHYQNQCWIVINCALWQSPESSFTRSTHELSPQYAFEDYIVKITTTSPMANKLTHWPLEDFNETFRWVLFKFILVTDGWSISCGIVLIWMSMDFTDDKSTLVQVMAWCCQATSHYLSQCWLRSRSPHGITRPQWVNFKAGGKW